MFILCFVTAANKTLTRKIESRFSRGISAGTFQAVDESVMNSTVDLVLDQNELTSKYPRKEPNQIHENTATV